VKETLMGVEHSLFSAPGILGLLDFWGGFVGHRIPLSASPLVLKKVFLGVFIHGFFVYIGRKGGEWNAPNL